LLCALVLFAMLAAGGSLAGEGRAQGEDLAYSVKLEGEIDTTRRRQLERTLQEAKENRARLAIVRLDTPGGDVESMRAMVRALLDSPLPVVVYVAPEGASAGSAGVFLTMAGDVAAMAPQTNIGSASPVLIGPEGPGEVSRAIYRKILNDAASYVRTLAEGHDRNADLAERMVRTATSVTARRARREGLVDLVADSEAALLKRLDGFRIKGAKAQVLHTAGLQVVNFDPAASLDEDLEMTGDGSLLFGLGLPGLISIAMLAAMAVFLGRQLLGRRPRRRFP